MHLRIFNKKIMKSGTCVLSKKLNIFDYGKCWQFDIRSALCELQFQLELRRFLKA